MLVRQVTVAFHPEQDRLLLRLNNAQGEEFRTWLTRRLLKVLLPHLRDTTALGDERGAGKDDADSAGARADANMKQLLAEFQKEAALQQADFVTPFESEPAALPLGPEPLLATHAHLSLRSEGALDVTLEERLVPPGGSMPRSFVVTLDPQMQAGLLHLIDSALGNSDWGLFGNADSSTAAQGNPGAADHGQRPKYLN